MNITYRTENGVQIPNLTVPEHIQPIGRYGQMRKAYLKQHRRSLYAAMMIQGTLPAHLAEVDRTATQQVERIVKQMAKAEGVDERLKAENPLKWTGLMNNLKHSAEEVVLKQLIHS